MPSSSFLPAIVIVVLLTGAGCFSSPTTSQPTGTPDVIVNDRVPDTNTAGPSPTTPPENPSTNPPAATVPAAQTVGVLIQNFSFSPSTITVKRGDQIVFTNRDSVDHTATSNDNTFDSGTLAQGVSYTVDTLKLSPGTYPYHCTLHPNMQGTIIVTE